jgi:transcription initiation factor TFIID subunit 3
MIGCDKCDDWYHWLCVGITSEPAENTDWYCPRCVLKNLKNTKDKKGGSSSSASGGKRGRPSRH